MRYVRVAGLVLLTVILARIFWVLLHSGVVLWKNRRFGFRPTRPGEQPPTFKGGLVVSWAGMRGIITLAAALALPAGEGAAFPYRDLIVLTAFAVVIGTLVVQGLTLKPLIRLLRLEDDDPVGRGSGRSARAGARGRSGDPRCGHVTRGRGRSPGARRALSRRTGIAEEVGEADPTRSFIGAPWTRPGGPSSR